MSDYQEAAQAYAEGVLSLFRGPQASPVQQRTRSGGIEVGATEEIAERAEELLPLSDDLSYRATAMLADEDPKVRADASARLLAKAATDIDIGVFLLDAAHERGAEGGGAAPRRSRSSGTSLREIQEQLQFLTGEATPRSLATRGVRAATNPANARADLSTKIGDTLTLILDRAARTGQAAFAGVLGLQISEIAGAAGLIGSNIAEALGQGEHLSRLYSLVREHITRAWEALTSLLSQHLVQAAGEQAVQWVEKLKEGELFGKLLEKVYNTHKTAQELQDLVQQSQVAPERYIAAINEIDALSGSYQQQVVWAGRLLKVVDKVRLVMGFVLASLVPFLNLLMPAIYIATGIYVTVAGADYVDADRLKLLDRVPGVSRVVREQLSAA